MPEGSEFCESCGQKMFQPPQPPQPAPVCEPPAQQQTQQPVQPAPAYANSYSPPQAQPYAASGASYVQQQPQQQQPQGGYGQYPYGQQQYQQPYGYPTYQTTTYTPKRTNTLALVGFITSLLFVQPVGLILAIFGLIECNKKQEDGRGLAIAGIIISALQVLVFVFFFVVGIFAAMAEEGYY